MNLQAAVESGRPFRSKTWKKRGSQNNWVQYCIMQRAFVFECGNKWYPNAYDFKNTDFEIKEMTMEEVVHEISLWNPNCPPTKQQLTKIVEAAKSIIEKEIPF